MAARSQESKRPPRREANRRPGPKTQPAPEPNRKSADRAQPIDRDPTLSPAPQCDTPACEGCGGPAGHTWRCYWGPILCRRCGEAEAARFDLEGWPRAPWEVTPAPAVAVLGASSAIGAGWEARGLPASFADLAAFAEHRRLEEVWIHAEALEPLGWPADLGRLRPGAGLEHPFLADLGAHRCNLEPAGLAPFARYWVPGGGHGFALHVPSYRRGARAPFAGTEDPWALLWALWLYREATGGRWPWRGAGSVTSDAWLRRRYRRPGALGPSEVAPPYAEGRAAEADFQWIRPPAPAERRARSLVAFDANAQYLGAASTLALPTGPLEHRDAWPEIEEGLPGYWLLEPAETYEGPGPAPWPARSPCWVTTPTAAYLAKDFGAHALEAWVWPERHQYLRPWYEELRDARAAALEIGGPALGAIKTLYKAGLGRLASSRRTEEGGPLFQPYWEQAVTALARCNLHRRLRRLEAEPVAVQVDALYFLTDRPVQCAEAFGVRIGLPIGEGLGQYKAKGLAPAAEAIAALEAGRPALATCRTFDELLEAHR